MFLGRRVGAVVVGGGGGDVQRSRQEEQSEEGGEGREIQVIDNTCMYTCMYM